MSDIITGQDNKTLRQKSLPVKRIDADVRSLIAKMKKEMEENDGAGLAAVQIGEPLSVIVCQLDDKFYSFINPEIVKSSSETDVAVEGCLSLPHIYGEVERPQKITLKALDFNGRKIKMKAFGMLARVIQHEMDHLNGVLFVDKAKSLQEDWQKSQAL